MSRKKKSQTKKNKTQPDKPSKYDKNVKIDATFSQLIDMAAKGYGAKKK